MGTVLILEGHDGMRQALIKLLTGMGIRSIEAHTPLINLNKIDLIIADEIWQSYFNSVYNDIPVIVLTSKAGTETNNVHYVNQPFEVMSLCDTISDLIHTHKMVV